MQMRKTILYIATSLDGFVAGRKEDDDDLSWLFPYNDVDYGYEEFFSHIGAIIQGRRTYDVEIQHGWENAHPVPTFVLSHDIPEKKTPQRSDVVFTHEDIAEVLKKAKKLTDKHIWIEGGANVAQQFLRRELIDEIVLSVVPVILGDGVRLFDNIEKQIDLSLIGVKRFDKGLVQLIYAHKDMQR
jgi:dihydrofolate reductase